MGPRNTSLPSGTRPKVSHVASLNSNGSPNSQETADKIGSFTWTSDHPNCSPSTQNTSVGTSPASGPLMPMSKSAFRSATRESMAITAPRVPMGPTGMGKKNGKLADTPYRRVWRKWPPSWQTRIVIKHREKVSPPTQ
jgi:hypothetical protein